MKDQLSKVTPLIVGSVIAVTLFFFPEAKPIACGAGFALPFLVN